MCAVRHFIISGRWNLLAEGQERVASTVRGLSDRTEQSMSCCCHCVYMAGMSASCSQFFGGHKLKWSIQKAAYFVSRLLAVLLCCDNNWNKVRSVVLHRITSAVGRSVCRLTAARVEVCWTRLVKYPPHVTGTCKLLSEFVRFKLQHNAGPKTNARYCCIIHCNPSKQRDVVERHVL